MPGGRIDIEVAPDLSRFQSALGAGLQRATGGVGAVTRGLGLAVAAGTAAAVVGLKNVIQLGNEYQANLNELGAVSGATASEMRRVGDVAKELGSDMSLPATSAADAAAAMVELAKGGLDVTEAMDAAKGTLQLAAAAQIDAAGAAEIQSSALNSFRLEADQAGRVADVLANTANAAAGSITDIGYSMKYLGPIAAALNISIEDTASSIGLLANQGIKGEQAGTTLRGILASLSSPSDQARAAMDQLGLAVFDAGGKFVGMRKFTEQLAAAKRDLTDAEFAAAASTAFGNEGLTGAVALAAEGAKGFDAMRVSVARQGGAAAVAAAKTKGLGGAYEGFVSQVETAAIGIYEAIDGPLEALTRSAAGFVERVTPGIVSGIETAVGVAETFGPRVVDAAQSKLGQVSAVGERIFGPIVDGLADVANEGVDIAVTAIGGFTSVVDKAVGAVEPLARNVGALVSSFADAGGPIGAVNTALGVTYDAVGLFIDVATPAVALVGDLVGLFADLPGPIQTAALGLLAFRVGPTLLGRVRDSLAGVAAEAGAVERRTGVLGRVFGTVLAPARLAGRAVASGVGSSVSTLRQFAGEARVQQELARASGAEVSRLGTTMSAFRTTALPAVAAVRQFGEQAAVVRASAAAASAPVSRLGAAFGVLVERSPGLAAVAARTGAVNRAMGDLAERAGLAAGVATESFARSIPRSIGVTVAAAARVPGAVGRGFISTLETVASTTDRAIQAVGDRVRALPGQLGAAFSGAGGAVSAGTRGIISSIQAVPTAVGVAALSVQDRVRSIGQSVTTGFGNAVSAVRAFPTAVGVAAINVQNAARRIPTALGVAVQGGVTALGRLGQAAATTGTAVATGLTRAATGLVGALGGPWGLAIAGATAALGLLASSQADAAAAAQKHKAGVDALAASLREAGGVVNGQVRGQIANTLVTEFQAGAAAAEKLGISMDEVISAALEGGPAFERYRQQFAGVLDEGVDAFSVDFSDEQKAVFEFLGTLDALSKRYADAREQNRRLSEVSGTTAGVTTGLSAAVDTLADSASTAADRAQALRDALKLLTGGVQDARDAQAAFYDAIDGISTSLEGMSGKVLDASGALDVTSQRGREVNRVIGQAQSAFTEYAAAQQAAGKSSSEITAGLGEMRAALIEVLTPLVGSQQAAAKLVDSFGLIPSDVAIAVTSPGLVSAQRAVDLLKGSLVSIQDNTVTVKALTAEAETELEALGFKIDRTNGVITVSADDAEAMKQLQNLLAVMNSSTGTPKIAANPRPAYDETGKLLGYINAATGTVTEKSNTVPAYNTHGQFIGHVNRSYATTTGRANFRPAYDETGRVIGYIDSRSATIKVGASTAGAQQVVDGFISTNSGRTIKIGIQPGGAFAAGGLVKAHATGSIDSLTPMRGGYAQIVPPNTWRVIGDRMRDDEAYIPINSSSRSVALLQETAHRMGFALARMYANGGLSGTGTSSMQVEASFGDGPMTFNLLDSSGALIATMTGVVDRALSRQARELQLQGRRG